MKEKEANMTFELDSQQSDINRIEKEREGIQNQGIYTRHKLDPMFYIAIHSFSVISQCKDSRNFSK